MRVGKSARIRTASGSGTASGLQTAISSPDVRANAAFRFAAYERGRSFSITRAPCRSAGRLPGRFDDDDELVHLRRQRRKRRLELARVPVRDDDAGDAASGSHRPPSSLPASCSNRASSSGSNDSRQPPICPLRNVGLALEKSRFRDARRHAPGRGGRRSRGSSAPASSSSPPPRAPISSSKRTTSAPLSSQPANPASRLSSDGAGGRASASPRIASSIRERVVRPLAVGEVQRMVAAALDVVRERDGHVARIADDE